MVDAKASASLPLPMVPRPSRPASRRSSTYHNPQAHHNAFKPNTTNTTHLTQVLIWRKPSGIQLSNRLDRDVRGQEPQLPNQKMSSNKGTRERTTERRDDEVHNVVKDRGEKRTGFWHGFGPIEMKQWWYGRIGHQWRVPASACCCWDICCLVRRHGCFWLSVQKTNSWLR